MEDGVEIWFSVVKKSHDLHNIHLVEIQHVQLQFSDQFPANE